MVSSRTSVSTLERGLYSPTLEKLDDIASVMQVHPITLLVGCYALKEDRSIDDIMATLRSEMDSVELRDAIQELQG